MRKAIVFLIILAVLPGVFAQYSGLEYVQTPEGSLNKIDTQVEASIENWGLERVFVAVPEGWTISEFKYPFGGTSYPLRFYATRYFELWGLPYDSNSLLGSGQVYDSNSAQTAVFDTIGGRQGWYLKPNEGITVKFGVENIDINGGIIDPFRLERENPDIRVVRWHQRFILNVSEIGFITAPWVVEGAPLTEASPAPYSAASGRGASKYYMDFEKTVSAPKWDAWFEVKSPLSSLLITKLAPTDLQFSSIRKIGTVRPVFRVTNFRTITYAYEWKRYEKIEGMTLWRNDFADVPDWFEWFK